MMPLDRNSKRLVVSVGRFLVLLGITALSWRACGGGEASPPPRCAWIAALDGPVLTLAEARIMAEYPAIWLERAEIDRVLAERRLQEAFGADAVSKRISLGRMLKADVLVLARVGGGEQPPFVELVLAETGGGMRILSRRIALTNDAEADAAKLCELVAVGLKKYGETIGEVYAVSPFLSQDLGYEHDHLRSAYAKLIEEMLLAQPGVLVVELKEADAIAREYALSDPQGRITRRLPIYILGEFRHEGREDTLRVKMTIKMRRGERMLDESRHLVSPATVPALFREITARWHESRGRAIVEPDVEAEVRALTDRVDELSRLGQWRDVQDLCEATLLLAPDRLDLRYRAIRAARLQLRGVPMDDGDACERRVSLRLRALEHSRIVVDAGIPEPDLLLQALYDRRTPIVHPGHVPWRLHDWERVSVEFVQPLMDLAISERQLSRQMADRYAELERWGVWGQCILHATDWKLPQQRNAERAAAILKHQDKLPARTVKDVCRSAPVSVENDQFFTALAESPEANELVRDVARELRDSLERFRQSSRERQVTEPTPSGREVTAPGGADSVTPLTFQPIRLTCPDLFSKKQMQLHPKFWQALPGSIDLLAESGWRVLLLKEPGVVIPTDLRIWGPQSRISDPSYDGKYVWLTRDDTILVMDPDSQRTWSIDSGDGLPDLKLDPGLTASSRVHVRVAGISPGKAIAVGFNGRTWYAMVHFDPQGEHRIEILYEARESSDHRDLEGSCNYLSPRAAFIPGNIHVLAGENPGSETPRSILVGRRATCSHFTSFPAILDLKMKTVRISPEPITDYPERYLIHKAENGKFDLAIREPPDGTLRAILPGIAPGYVVVHEDELHIIGRQWCRGSLSGKSLESCGPVPWKLTGYASAYGGPDPHGKDAMEITQAGYSNHYGPWVMLYHPKHGRRILQVLFDGSGLSYDKAIASRDVPEKPARDDTLGGSAPLACYRLPDKPEVLWEGDSRGCRELVYTADGKYILTAHLTPEHGLRLWEASTGQLVADLLAGEPGLCRIAMSRSGKYFVTGSDDGSVILWSTSGWTPICHLEGQRGTITSLAFSWDERRVAASSQGSAPCIWDVATGRELVRITDNMLIRWIGFTSDDARLITSFQDGNVRYWSASDGSFISQVETVNWIGGFTPDRKLLAVGNDLEHSLIVWDTNTETVQRLPFQARFVPWAVSPDGRRMVFSRRLGTTYELGGETYRVWVWDFSRSEELFEYSGPLTHQQFRFSPDGNVLFVLGKSQPPWRFELPSGEPPESHEQPPVHEDDSSRAGR